MSLNFQPVTPRDRISVANARKCSGPKDPSQGDARSGPTHCISFRMSWSQAPECSRQILIYQPNQTWHGCLTSCCPAGSPGSEGAPRDSLTDSWLVDGGGHQEYTARPSLPSDWLAPSCGFMLDEAKASAKASAWATWGKIVTQRIRCSPHTSARFKAPGGRKIGPDTRCLLALPLRQTCFEYTYTCTHIHMCVPHVE